MIINRPKQRVSISEKMKPSYYKDNIHYYISIAMSSNDKIITQNNIDASNGIVPASTYEYVMAPITGGDGTKNNLPGVIRDTDFITPIREKNIGEYIELPNDFTVKIDDPNISILKNKEVADKIKPIIEQAVVNAINAQQGGQQGGQPTGVPSTEDVDIKGIVDETVANWIDERADHALMLIKSINNDNDLEAMRLTLFNNWWSTEECYIYVYLQNGSIFYDAINPMEGYPISNGSEFTDDQEGFVIKRRLTMDRIEEYYGDDLTKKDRQYLDSLLDSYSDGVYGITNDMYQDIYGSKAFGESNGNKRLVFSNGRDIAEYVLLYKTEVERKILIYQNELGEIQQRVIEEEDFVFDEEQGHITVEKEWISETWKQVLLGEEEIGIYIKPKPIEVQSYDDRGHNKLPIVGKKGLVNGVYINPIPARIIPNLALHKVITLQIERQIAKFKGSIELIPQGMIQADANGSTAASMFYKIADNTIIYDETKVDFNTVAQGYRMVGNDSASNYIRVLIDYRDSLKAEAWDMANMNDGRAGNAAPSSTVTNNQQNIFNAKLGSVLSITMFNNILTRLYNTILTYAEYAYPDGISGNTFTREGDVKYFNIDSGVLTANKYGIYMTNAVLDFQKLKEYKEFAFAAGQNGDFGLATAAISGESISGIRSKVNEYIKTKDEYDKSVQQQEQAQTKQIHDEIMAAAQTERDAKTNDMVTKENMITERMVTIEGMKQANVTNK